MEALDIPAISVVQDNIAHQVGLYIAASHREPSILVAGKPTAISQVRSPDGGELFACGTGGIAFDITSIDAELTTTSTVITGGEISAVIPAEAVVISPSYSGTRTTDKTGKLDYNLWPLPYEEQTNIPKGEIIVAADDAPIAYTLLSLRSAILGGATRYDFNRSTPMIRPWKPCFRDYNPANIEGGSGNTYTLGLKVTGDDKVGLKVSVGGIVTIGASGERTSSTGNTLTVTFGQTGLQKLVKAKAVQQTECQRNPNSLRCHEMIDITSRLDVQNQAIKRMPTRVGLGL